MEIRERLLRNEVRHLAQDLKAISLELITLQDFVRKEFGTKYVRFCEHRQVIDGDADEPQADEIHLSNRGATAVTREHYSTPIERSSSPIIVSVRSSAVSLNDGIKQLGCQNKGAQEDEDYSDSSDPPIFNVLDEGEEENFDSYLPGYYIEEDSSQEAHKRYTKRKQTQEEDDPDFDMQQFLKEEASGAVLSGTKKLKKAGARSESGQPTETGKKEKRKVYTKIREYDSLEEAKADVHKEWTGRSSYSTFEGTRYRYRCRVNRLCRKCLYIFEESGTVGSTVSLWESTNEHGNHIENKNRGLTSDFREKVKQLYESGIKKTRHVLFALEKRGVEIPKEDRSFRWKMNNYMGRLRILHNDVKKRPPKNSDDTTCESNCKTRNKTRSHTALKKQDRQKSPIVECPLPFNSVGMKTPLNILDPHQGLSHQHSGHGGVCIPLHGKSHIVEGMNHYGGDLGSSIHPPSFH